MAFRVERRAARPRARCRRRPAGRRRSARCRTRGAGRATGRRRSMPASPTIAEPGLGEPVDQADARGLVVLDEQDAQGLAGHGCSPRATTPVLRRRAAYERRRGPARGTRADCLVELCGVSRPSRNHSDVPTVTRATTENRRIRRMPGDRYNRATQDPPVGRSVHAAGVREDPQRRRARPSWVGEDVPRRVAAVRERRDDAPRHRGRRHDRHRPRRGREAALDVDLRDPRALRLGGAAAEPHRHAGRSVVPGRCARCAEGRRGRGLRDLRRGGRRGLDRPPVAPRRRARAAAPRPRQPARPRARRLRHRARVAASLSDWVVAVAMPMGQEHDYAGVIDLVHMGAYPDPEGQREGDGSRHPRPSTWTRPSGATTS